MKSINSIYIFRRFRDAFRITLLSTILPISIISVKAQDTSAVHAQNFSCIKGCDIPEYLDSVINIKGYSHVFQKDYKLIQFINRFDCLEYWDFKEATKHFKKIYKYTNKYPTDSFPRILSVSESRFYNRGFCTLSIQLYLDDNKKIIYRYLSLEIDRAKCDFSYVKLLLKAVKVNLHFTTCFSADLEYGESKVARLTGRTSKATGL